MCIQQGKTLNDPGRLEHRTPSYYIQSPDEFNQKFKDIPEALENTVKIAKRCNVELKLGKSFLPKYEVPEGFDRDSYLRKVAQEGLERRFVENRAQCQAVQP